MPSLPADYAEFLQKTPAPRIRGDYEIMGPDGPPHLNTTKVLEKLRGQGVFIPKGILPIAAVGNGEYIAILTEQFKEHLPGHVVYWDPKKPRDPERLKRSFKEWLSTAGGRRELAKKRGGGEGREGTKKMAMYDEGVMDTLRVFGLEKVAVSHDWVSRMTESGTLKRLAKLDPTARNHALRDYTILDPSHDRAEAAANILYDKVQKNWRNGPVRFENTMRLSKRDRQMQAMDKAYRDHYGMRYSIPAGT